MASSNGLRDVECDHMNRISKIVFGLCVISVAFSCSQSPSRLIEQGPAGTVAGRQLFGINLRPEAAALLEEVEKYYGKPIREELRSDWDPGYWGESEVVGDGTPVIRINRQTGRNEINIVHELWHLKLTAKGFPKRMWEKRPGVRDDVNQDLTRDLNGLLLDAILHSKFYPEMRKAGYDADAWDRPQIKAMMQVSLLDGIHVMTTRREIQPLTYFKFYLESSDRAMVSQLEQWHKQNRLDDVLETAKRLVGIAVGLDTNTPEQQIDAYVRCMNVLLEGIAQFRTAGWGTEKLGDKFTRRTVIIQILPPR